MIMSSWRFHAIKFLWWLANLFHPTTNADLMRIINTNLGEEIMKKTRKRLPYTPTSVIKNALRRLWLHSREHSAALKLAGYRCAMCGVKQSRAKNKKQTIEIHHIPGVDWDGIIRLIRVHLLMDTQHLKALCPECHKKVHGKGQQE